MCAMDNAPCRGWKTVRMALVGLGSGVILVSLVIVLGPFLAHPAFDVFWGPLLFVVLKFFSSEYLWKIYPIWWAFLVVVPCRRHRRLAVALYAVHVLGGPVARYVLYDTGPFYLERWYHPMLWLLWSPMVAFTGWYFGAAFGIKWREVGKRVLAALLRLV